MTDPSWDIPGVTLGAHACASTSDADAAASPGSGASSSGRSASRGGRSHPAGSVSVSAGSSAGAFATSAAGGSASAASSAGAFAGSAITPPPAGPKDGSPGDATLGSSQPDANAGAGSAAPGADGVQASDPVEALAFLRAGLEYLAHAEAADWTAGMQADCLRALAVAESQHAAAHARVLAAFAVPGGGLNGDGHRSPRVWLTWQTQATRRAAATHVARMHDLEAHPRVAAALAAGQVSLSWARQITDWTGPLPEEHRDDGDAELLAAAAAGTDLPGLAGIAEELRRQHASADAGDSDSDGFDDRAVRFATTFDGAGLLDGDLTARCAAAVHAVLDSLAAVRGPEDTRTLAQRRHDALEEACTRLIAADCLPQRAGQPVRLELTITLDELNRGGGGPAGPGADCDAVIQPVITGHVDDDLLHHLADDNCHDDAAAAVTHEAAAREAGDQPNVTAGDRDGILSQAIALLSGPAGHAALLRSRLGGPAAAAISLPLDIAGTLDTIPVHLRRAVRKRDKHCRFPGCDLPAAGCDVHHLVHRKDGGRHALTNLALLCRFHHLVAIHRWGWHITLHPDGTTTAISPDGSKTLHSHPPPGKAA